GPQAILTRPGAASRTGEVESIGAVLKQLLPETAVQKIEPPATLDGGDICEAGNHFFIGVSARTNESGAQQLANFVGARGYTSSFVDIRGMDSLLHLKSGLAYAGDNRLVITEPLADLKELEDFDVVTAPSG